MNDIAAATGYKTAEVARMLGWTPAAVRASVRNGYVHPERGARREFVFTFQDLVALRAVKQLLDAGLPKRRVTQALGRLVKDLPEERTLAGVRVLADGDRVVVEDGKEIWNPESGQRVLDFRLAKASQSSRPLRHEPSLARQGPDLAAEEWYQLGVDLEVESPQEAKAAYRKAVEIEATYVDAHLNLGRLLHEEGRVRTAEECYRRALELRPADATACFNLAVALEDLGRPMEALSAYERVIELDPQYADAYFNVAGIYERLGKRAEAVRYLKTYKNLTNV